MSADEKKNFEEEKNEEYMKIPDMVELWKEMYFKNEEAWANSAKQAMATQTFLEMLTQMRNQYLSYEKVNRQNLDKYFESSPIPSKKDIARVAELVIALEEKIDDIDMQFSNNINLLTDNLIKLVDYQDSLKNEINSVKSDVDSLKTKLDNMNKKLNTLTKTFKENTGETQSQSTKTKKTKQSENIKEESVSKEEGEA
ncbi:hypothetical protein SYNTR_1036 [Candidatus Syntrophocurvum alkaliphilum]|uniref:Polyhydroxyalkanoate synthesis repressor PhaR n=1 Tax=Candidatus Syntrophocurvum alkaliphilum TaxID=2293317 RepID=A0A6I6DBF0_9FIRM|nr:hypothetical protein [Candidatus Syntrophocurvum alkaliphilum]QGT99629.1 hypothetical protein SYNTR_1036 [Candidatus Syntrophocurvum alkaliphilum]